MKYSILTPLEYSGSQYGDHGYEINGVKSTKGYVSFSGARSAMWRAIEKIEKQVAN